MRTFSWAIILKVAFEALGGVQKLLTFCDICDLLICGRVVWWRMHAFYWSSSSGNENEIRFSTLSGRSHTQEEKGCNEASNKRLRQILFFQNTAAASITIKTKIITPCLLFLTVKRSGFNFPYKLSLKRLMCWVKQYWSSNLVLFNAPLKERSAATHLILKENWNLRIRKIGLTFREDFSFNSKKRLFHKI